MPSLHVSAAKMEGETHVAKFNAPILLQSAVGSAISITFKKRVRKKFLETHLAR